MPDDMPSSEKSSLNIVEHNNGTVQVKEGEIIVTDPCEDGRMAKIAPGDNVRIFVDEAEIFAFTPVSKNSNIKILLQNKNPERKLDISVADDRMSAYIKACYTDGVQYVLKDFPPSYELRIDAEVLKVIGCECFKIEEAVDLLKRNGIVYGICEEKVKEAILKENSNTKIEVACGLKPIDGTDDAIKAHFEEEKKFTVVNDRVDFYSIGRVVSVNANNLVAEKIPGKDGEAGIDVFGNKIPQKKGKKIEIKAGRGVRLSPDGFKVYSTINGRPEIKGDVVSVYETYEVSSNVDISTGNIEFSGDVIIKGDVTDGMKVKAGGSVFLYGSITDGYIEAGCDVRVQKNIISSEIKAGCFDLVKYNIIDHMEVLEKGLKSIFSAVGELKDTGKITNIYKDGKIIKALLDTKFRSITQCIMKLKDLLFENKDHIDRSILEVGARLIKYFTGNGPLLIENSMDIMAIADELIKRIEFLRSSLMNPSQIYINYVQNSKISTSGDIEISGKGCYNSELNCKGSVIFKRSGSVMRGGSINAGGNVSIYELGSPGGANTSVSTNKDSIITCEVAYLNSVVKVGDVSKKLDASVKKLKAYQYKGELIIESLKLLP